MRSAASDAGDDAADTEGSVDPAAELSRAATGQRAGRRKARPGVDGDEELIVFCPNCDFTDEGPSPSLREGDSCPRCRTAYLSEREL